MSDTTIAERIAAQFDDHSLLSEALCVGGVPNLSDVCLRQAVAVAEGRGGCTRYTFADGSAITTNAVAWDVGYADCFCWEGHESACEQECE